MLSFCQNDIANSGFMKIRQKNVTPEVKIPFSVQPGLCISSVFLEKLNYIKLKKYEWKIAEV